VVEVKPEAGPVFPPDSITAIALQAEYVDWRTAQGLNPSIPQLQELHRLSRIARKAGLIVGKINGEVIV
jgi:hypothetical protein